MEHRALTTSTERRRSDRLLGRKVLVTGSSKGIGRGIAVRFAQEGADVVVNYNSDPRGAEEVLAEILSLGRRGAILRANVGSVSEVRDLVVKSAEALGGLDVLINNAGIEKQSAFWDVTESDFDVVLDVNLRGSSSLPRPLRSSAEWPGVLARSSTSARCTKSSPSRTSPPTAPARAVCGC